MKKYGSTMGMVRMEELEPAVIGGIRLCRVAAFATARRIEVVTEIGWLLRPTADTEIGLLAS